jgi:16S rRNA (uracil1498-N3)-methyltransferase
VSGIIPVVTARTIVRPDEASGGKKSERWRKIAAEAAKQCQRADIPEVADITGFDDALRSVGLYDLALFAWLSGDTVPLKNVLAGFKGKSIIVFIGPEGDFTPDEADRIKFHANVRMVSLGPRVLKSDTAGLFVLSAVNYESA